MPDDINEPTGPKPRLRVELAGWTQRLPTRTRGQVRRAAVVSVVSGILLVALTVAGTVAFLMTRPLSPELLGGVFLAAVGGLLCWQGAHRLSWVPRDEPGAPVQFAAPYAFDVSADTVEFPAYAANRAESWPFAATRIEVVGDGSGRVLRLSCPGRRTRNYPARGLADSPAEVARRIEPVRASAPPSIG